MTLRHNQALRTGSRPKCGHVYSPAEGQPLRGRSGSGFCQVAMTVFESGMSFWQSQAGGPDMPVGMSGAGGRHVC